MMVLTIKVGKVDGNNVDDNNEVCNKGVEDKTGVEGRNNIK